MKMALPFLSYFFKLDGRRSQFSIQLLPTKFIVKQYYTLCTSFKTKKSNHEQAAQRLKATTNYHSSFFEFFQTTSSSKLMKAMSSVDIFSDDFFAADPFGDDTTADIKVVDFVSKNLELQMIEESICHTIHVIPNDLERQLEGREASSVADSDSDIYLDEEKKSEQRGSPADDDDDEDDDDQASSTSLQTNNEEQGGIKIEQDDIKIANPLAAVKAVYHDDSGTHTTCRSTDNENQSSQSSLQEDTNAILPDNINQMASANECSDPSCILLRRTLQQQEEQICFLRRKLQEYANLCERYDIGRDILGTTTRENDKVLDTIHSGTARTTYEETTYKDMMGPWDIPFHVELLEPKDSFGEYSGITFAQHPSKVDTTVHRIRSCPTDDDDALPVLRTKYTKKSTKRKSKATKPRQSRQYTNNTPLAIERLWHRVYSSESNHHKECTDTNTKEPDVALLDTTTTVHEDKPTKVPDKRVKSMPVVLERKYGRQKALYSGTVHPTSGCPHGAGTFQFVASGDVYIGDVAYGEMHGRGTYCHRKTNKLFRGDFSRNSFVGIEK